MKEQNALNRRQFLKLAGLTAGAVALASCTAPIAPSAPGESAADAGTAAEGVTLRYRTWHAPAQSAGSSRS